MQHLRKIIIICLFLVMCALTVISVSAYTTDFPKSYRLWQGSAAMHEIGVSGYCGTQITVQSPYGASFDLYAMKNYGSPGTCRSNEYIMSHYDKFSYSSGSGGSATLYLEQGLWCVVVYARSGSGTAYVTADSNCHPPGPVPTPYPPYPTPCSPYKTVDRSGYLYQGQAAVYGYIIPNDGRSQIEWTVTGSGSGSTPIIVSSMGSQVFSSHYGPNFDVYVFKDCNPQYYYCNTNYYANGPNPYVSIANPQRGSIYYVMVYARSGSGTYNLRMNSYKCFGDTPIIVASAPVYASTSYSGFESAGSGTGYDTAVSSSVAAPTADFVPVSSQ
ncbi:MAG: hypothetical protein GXY48_12985 [Methanomicrobiales archaeon]|nr:hypothetical protein [Methanomicrobiales archaeon]